MWVLLLTVLYHLLSAGVYGQTLVETWTSASMAYARGDWNEAIKDYSSVIYAVEIYLKDTGIDPGAVGAMRTLLPGALYEIGVAYVNVGDWTNALVNYRKLVHFENSGDSVKKFCEFVEILEKNGLVSLLMVNELELCEKKEFDVLYKKPEAVQLRGSLQYSQLATIDSTDIFLARITSIKFLNNVVSAAKWRKSWDTGRMISNRGGWQSHTDFLSGVHMSGNELIDTTMVTLRNTIQNFVWMSLKHSPEYKDLRIEQIDAHSVWAQISNKGNWNSRHTHGYGWSGVLYIDADDKGSLLELYDPRPQCPSSSIWFWHKLPF